MTGYRIVAIITSEKTNFTYFPIDESGSRISMNESARIMMKRLLTHCFTISVISCLLPYP